MAERSILFSGEMVRAILLRDVLHALDAHVGHAYGRRVAAECERALRPPLSRITRRA